MIELLFAVLIRGYDVDIRVDAATKTISGTETVTVSGGAGPVVIPLHGQKIVRVDGGTSIVTADELRVDGASSFTVEYTVAEPKGVTFTPTVIYTGFDTCTWMICDDRPSIRATIAMTLHPPAGQSTLGAGRDDDPRPAYLYGFAIGQLRSASIVDGDTILEAVSADVSQEELVAILRRTEGMAGFFETKAGQRLRRHRYTQLIVKGSAAQEKSSFSIIGTDQLAALTTDPTEDWAIAHEMAHQFWGNLVTPHSWTEMWLSEGLVTFMTAAWKEHRWGRAYYDREMKIARDREKFAVDAGYDKPLAWNGAYPSLRLKRAIAYSRGALFFDQLRQRAGEAAFWKGVATFTRRHANESVTSRDLERAFPGNASLFRTWVYGAPDAGELAGARRVRSHL